MEDLYLKKEEYMNTIYSIDMLRLKGTLTVTAFSELEFRFDTVYREYIKNKYNSFKISDFKYNYNIEIEEGKSFWFGFFHNSEKPCDSPNGRYNFTLEFNPNKLKENNIIRYLINLCDDWVIKSFDLAIDLKLNILDLCGYDKGRKKDIRVFSQGYDNRTVYMGRGDNRIKIYNKKIESNLNILGELTRIEISCKLDNFPIKNIRFYKFNGIFPCIYTNDYMYTFKDYEDKTLLAILYAVQSGFYISDLTRVYRKKVKALLEGGHKIVFSEKIATKILVQVIVFYFIHSRVII